MSQSQASDELVACLAPRFIFIFIFNLSISRPLTYEEVQEDISHVIKHIATESADPSSPFLNYEEIERECECKVATIIDQGWLEEAKSREEFFKYLTACMKNHVRSLIGKYAFTFKRTGVKPPPKEERYLPFNERSEYRKPVNISMNDPEFDMQIPAMPDWKEETELEAEIKALLDPQELLVFQQMTCPNGRALSHAYCDAFTGLKKGRSINVRIRKPSLAFGVAMSVKQYTELEKSIRQKVKAFMEQEKSNSSEQAEYNLALGTLKQVFGLQIPASLPDLMCRRLITIAAHCQYHKVESDPNLARLIKIVGARVPEKRGDLLQCFGLMYEKGHRHCNRCHVCKTCAEAAFNVGLGEIKLSPRLMTAKCARVPVLLPTFDAAQQSVETERDDELVDFLNQNFKKSVRNKITVFSHKGKSSKPIFRTSAPFNICFCNPSESVQMSLEFVSNGGRKAWYLPATCDSKTALNLMRVHARETLTEQC